LMVGSVFFVITLCVLLAQAQTGLPPLPFPIPPLPPFAPSTPIPPLPPGFVPVPSATPMAPTTLCTPTASSVCTSIFTNQQGSNPTLDCTALTTLQQCLSGLSCPAADVAVEIASRCTQFPGNTCTSLCPATPGPAPVPMAPPPQPVPVPVPVPAPMPAPVPAPEATPAPAPVPVPAPEAIPAPAPVPAPDDASPVAPPVNTGCLDACNTQNTACVGQLNASSPYRDQCFCVTQIRNCFASCDPGQDAMDTLQNLCASAPYIGELCDCGAGKVAPEKERIMSIIDENKNNVAANWRNIPSVTSIVIWDNKTSPTVAAFYLIHDGSRGIGDLLTDLGTKTVEYMNFDSNPFSFKFLQQKRATAATDAIVIEIGDFPATGLSGGAIAAIVICTLLIVAIIIGLVYFYVFKPKNPEDSQPKPEYA